MSWYTSLWGKDKDGGGKGPRPRQDSSTLDGGYVSSSSTSSREDSSSYGAYGKQRAAARGLSPMVAPALAQQGFTTNAEGVLVPPPLAVHLAPRGCDAEPMSEAQDSVGGLSSPLMTDRTVSSVCTAVSSDGEGPTFGPLDRVDLTDRKNPRLTRTASNASCSSLSYVSASEPGTPVKSEMRALDGAVGVPAARSNFSARSTYSATSNPIDVPPPSPPYITPAESFGLTTPPRRGDLHPIIRTHSATSVSTMGQSPPASPSPKSLAPKPKEQAKPMYTPRTKPDTADPQAVAQHKQACDEKAARYAAMLEKHIKKAPTPAPLVRTQSQMDVIANTQEGRKNRGIAAATKDQALIKDLFGNHLQNAWTEDSQQR